jgi:hypothetical protein
VRILLFIFLSSALLFAGCARPDYIQQREQCEKEGWRYCETMGTESSDGKFFMWMSSDTAQHVDVGVVIDGKQFQKSYPQQEYLYRGYLYTKPSGDSFALIFRKEKPKP